MASFGTQLSFFLLLVLVLSPQIQAREGKFFSLFTHFRTTYNAKDRLVLLKKAKVESPAPAPTSEITAPTPEPTPTPAPAPEPEPRIVSGPAPEPEPVFVDRGDGYGLYGTGSSQFSPTKETPTTTTFENELPKSYKTDKTGYPNTNLYSNNYNNQVYRNNYFNNQDQYRSNYKQGNGYSKNNYVDSYSNNNYNDQYYNNNYNGNEYYNNNYNGINGYEKKKEGMSDTRFLENGKYYYHVKNNENENYNLNGYESGRGSTENEGFYEEKQFPNEFDTMEEYEKQQESQGYRP